MRAAMLGLVAVAALGGCKSERRDLTIDNPRIRLNADPAAPAAAYFTIKGGAQPDRLLSVTSEVNLRTELHDSAKDAHGATTMPTLTAVDIPAGQNVEFKPGGKHAMLFGMQADVKPYQTVALTFTFASGLRLVASARTRGPGEVL